MSTPWTGPRVRTLSEHLSGGHAQRPTWQAEALAHAKANHGHLRRMLIILEHEVVNVRTALVRAGRALDALEERAREEDAHAGDDDEHAGVGLGVG